MKANKFVLGIHYHSPFYQDKNGNVHIVSFIGGWIESLSHYFKEVVYLGHITEERIESQDYCIKKGKNISFYSTGPFGGITTIFRKVRNTRKTLKEIEGLIDGIIVRAPTPRQATILDNFNGKNKALYIVGEPVKKPLLPFLKKRMGKDFIIELLNRRRKKQTDRLANKCLVIANNPGICEKYNKSSGKKAFYCPSSDLEESHFYLVGDRCTGDIIRLLFVGRVCRDKGIVELLEATKILKEKNRKIILNIVGSSGDADSIESFKQLAEKENIDDIVIWNGRIPFGQELFDFYRNSDFLILPSAHEGFPRVVWEALANGVLVLVTKVGGIPYICSHKQNVFFIEKSSQSIVEAIEELLVNADLRRRMISNGYILAKENLQKNCAEKMTRILEELWD